MNKELLSGLSAEEKASLLEQLQNEKKSIESDRRSAYEGLRHSFVVDVFQKLQTITDDTAGFRKWIEQESGAFTVVMSDYGQLRYESQQSFTIVDGDMKLEVKSNKVKSFDERADMAAKRLMDFLSGYAKDSDKGIDDPMYQLAMTLLERNRQGDLDYKSISKLYELESKFKEQEYSDIMQLFKESNVVYKTATNYYFHRRDKNGVWRRIEPSFCRM